MFFVRLLLRGGANWGSANWGAFNWGGSSGISAAFTYDGNLKRVKKVEGSDTVYTIYSLVSNLLYQDDATTSTHTAYLGIGPAEIRFVNGTPTYIHADAQGSPVAATNPTGPLLWTEHYTPFGETLLNPTGNTNNTAFTGYLKDSDFALNYAQARYQDPATGRFLEADPMREADQVNLYAYVGNDPVNTTDPTGTTTSNGDDTFCGAGCESRYNSGWLSYPEQKAADAINSGNVSAYMHYYWAADVFGPRYHSYLEIRNGSDGHFYLSGGPAIRGGGGGNGTAYILLDAAGLARWDPIYGDLKAWAAPKTSSSTYSRASGQWSVPLGRVNMNWSAAEAVLTDEAAAVNSMKITYDAIYENSNSVSFSGARALGLNPTPPANLSVPAWQTNIPIGY
jgi:RHS repeat-associated protein